MIGRIWHGWTKPESADGYERLLKKVIFLGGPATEYWSTDLDGSQPDGWRCLAEV